MRGAWAEASEGRARERGASGAAAAAEKASQSVPVCVRERCVSLPSHCSRSRLSPLRKRFPVFRRSNRV